jgi:hypothetical protein
MTIKKETIKSVFPIILLVLAIIIFVQSLRNARKVEPVISEVDLMVELSERYNWLNTIQKVKGIVKEPLTKMIDDAESEGLCLVVTSGYRTAEQQIKIQEEYGDLAETTEGSEHRTGMAVDLTACPMLDGKRNDDIERLELKKPFNELPEYFWLRQNAIKYGFTQTYENEPWHWLFNEVIPTVNPKRDPLTYIRWKGQQEGYDDYTISKFIRLARAESFEDLDQYAKNPNSTAKGIYQFIDSTWRQYCLENGNVYDFVDNIDCFYKILATDGYPKGLSHWSESLSVAGLN